jgi:hypothetical protein
MIGEETAREAARHITGATIAWGGGHYYDFAQPNPEVITLEDAAYALAYTVRWRGQTRTTDGRRCFYGVGQHCCIMAAEMEADGYGPLDCLTALWHEDDEVVLPDFPGPAKDECPGFRPLAKRQGDAIRARFRIPDGDKDLLKRYDIRMLVTERRDLMPRHDKDSWECAEETVAATRPGFEAFARRIVGTPSPDGWALRFMRMHRSYCHALGIHTE